MIITIIIVAVKQAGLQKILRIHASGVTDRKREVLKDWQGEGIYPL